jgi:hypothetical protein
VDEHGAEGEVFKMKVLVDCRANMFEGDEPYFSTVMGVLVKVLKDKIISNDTDELGILLYGTRETHNPWNFRRTTQVLRFIYDASQKYTVFNTSVVGFICGRLHRCAAEGYSER